MMKSKIIIAILLLVGIVGCKTPKTIIEKEHQESSRQTDSVNILIEKTTKVLATPQAMAKLTLTPEDIANLPVGASYQAKEGNATGTLKKTEDNNLEFTANCDSLLVFADEIKKEVYHLNSLNTALKTQLKKQTIKEVNVLTGWQWFQIYGFRIYVLLTFIFIIYKNIKNGKIKRLFQAISAITRGV